MEIKRLSAQSWRFDPGVPVVGAAAVCGPKEGEGPLGKDMDHIFSDLRLGQKSFEKAEQLMQMQAARIALERAHLPMENLDFFCGGDLLNQLTPTCFTARTLGASFLGLFSACATSTAALSLAALAVASGAVANAMALSSSHTCTAERQFRYPNEYGSQKPPYSQQTATAAGALVLSRSGQALAKLSGVTLGKVIDIQITDPFKLGPAMAPAFADTVSAHLRDWQRQPEDYDLILSGDLGRHGSAIALELLKRKGIHLPEKQYADCGLLLYGEDDSVFAGGSGCGCAASVGFGHILRRIAQGELKRVLLVATGALLSPLANQQQETIPGIAHGVILEGIGNAAQEKPLDNPSENSSRIPFEGGNEDA
ncbi:MAG: stage V sporulation protein AD [Firmicutes bacterium]|nr:stage V sporulation protein AD [Bacillota bacterium]